MIGPIEGSEGKKSTTHRSRPNGLDLFFVYKPRTENQIALGRFKLVRLIQCNQNCPLAIWSGSQDSGSTVPWTVSPLGLTTRPNFPREVWLHWTCLIY